MRRRAGPVTEMSVFATEISLTELEIFPIWGLLDIFHLGNRG